MSNSVEVHALTQRLAQLEELANAISYAEIYMCVSTYTSEHTGHRLHYNINSTEMNLTRRAWDYEKIKLFYKLDKLALNNCSDMFKDLRTMKIKNKTTTSLKLISLNVAFTSLIGLDDFPNLETLLLKSCPGIQNVVSVLSSYKNKIKFIKIQECPAINITELITYCQTNEITLELV